MSSSNTLFVIGYLFAGDARVAVGGGAEDEVVEDGGVGRDADAAADHDGHLELVPVLVAAAEGSVQLDLGVHDVGVEVARVEVVAQLPGPRALRLDVAREEVFVRRRRQRERVELFGLDLGAGQADPLAGQVLEVGRPVELDFEHVAGQELRLDDVELHELGAQADDFVEREDDGRAEDEEPETRRRRQPAKAVDDGQRVEHNVKAVRHPEVVVSLFTDRRVGEDEDDDDDAEEEDAGDAGQRAEEPVGDGRFEVGREGQLFGQAAQVFDGLRRHVVKVDDVADRVEHREKEGRQGADLVERNVGVERDELLDGELFEFGERVARHGEQQEGVAERHGVGRAARDGDADAHDVAQVRVLGHERVVDEALDEQRDRRHVEDKQVEDVLAVALEEGDDAVPTAEPRVAVALLHGVDVEARHARHVGRRVQKVLLGALAVETDGDKVAAVLLHHQLEVVVVERVLVLQAGRLEHAVDQLRHLVVAEAVVGARDLDQRAQHLAQLHLVDDAVAVVVAHVEDDAQLVLRLALGKEHHRVEELLERDAPVAVLVDDVEHHLHEDVVALHAQRVGELVARQRRPHHHDDVTGDVLQLALLARLQAERQRVGLAEKVFQSLLSPLARLGIGQHLFAVRRQLFQVLLVAGEERLQFVQEALARRRRVKLEHQVVVARHAHQKHRLLARVLRHLHRQHVHRLELDLAQLLALAVHRVERLVGPELDFDQSLVVQVQPLLDDHLVDRLAVVVLLVARLQPAPLRVLQLHHAVAGAGRHDRHEAQ